MSKAANPNDGDFLRIYYNGKKSFILLYEYVIEWTNVQYSNEKHKSINLDYVKNRIYNLYKLKWLLWITEFDILLKHILDLFKTK